jgi:hypothetical protein
MSDTWKVDLLRTNLVVKIGLELKLLHVFSNTTTATGLAPIIRRESHVTGRCLVRIKQTAHEHGVELERRV